ncbi:MAG: sulfatase-like hydrolase/transferase [bacterium]|nr:sulfatase-like hydrolase/transferase [bacterium]
MNRREFLAAAAAAGAALVAGPHYGAAAAPATTGRPNLLFIMSDQQSFDMLGCYGNDQIVTPNIDKAAAAGVRFTHCISNSPVCTPYRGLLMSSMHPLYTGAISNDFRMLASADATLGKGKYFGEVLRDAGYRMGYVGKWHLYGGDRVRPIPAGPYRLGFDGTFLSNNCTLLFDKERAYYWDEQGKKQLYGDWEPYGQARQAMKFLDQNDDRPFALFVAWHPPHNWGGENGYAAPEDLLKLYDPAKLKLRPSVEDTPQIRQMYQGHMAMCSSLDKAFGWIMDKLAEKGLAENTVVVYTSDHGDCLLSRGWRGHKGCPQDEACRVPLIIRYPGKLAPRASDLLVGALDLMPTLLGTMGLPVPETCQGRDLSPAIAEGRDDAVEELPLWLLAGNWRGVYTRRYTYAFTVEGARKGKTMPRNFELRNCLYDRQADPRELNNLFESPGHRDLRDRLHERTMDWMRRLGDGCLTYETIADTALEPAELAISRRGRLAQEGDGKLKGRPIDILKTTREQSSSQNRTVRERKVRS